VVQDDFLSFYVIPETKTTDSQSVHAFSSRNRLQFLYRVLAATVIRIGAKNSDSFFKDGNEVHVLFCEASNQSLKVRRTANEKRRHGGRASHCSFFWPFRLFEKRCE